MSQGQAYEVPKHHFLYSHLSERDSMCLHLLAHSPPPKDAQANLRTWGLHPGLSQGWQGPKGLKHFLLCPLSTHLSRQLGGKQSSWNLNRARPCGMWVS